MTSQWYDYVCDPQNHASMFYNGRLSITRWGISPADWSFIAYQITWRNTNVIIASRVCWEWDLNMGRSEKLMASQCRCTGHPHILVTHSCFWFNNGCEHDVWIRNPKCVCRSVVATKSPKHVKLTYLCANQTTTTKCAETTWWLLRNRTYP